jgi:hypothetical protein
MTNDEATLIEFGQVLEAQAAKIKELERGGWIPIEKHQPPIGKSALLASRCRCSGDGVIADWWHQWVHTALIKEPIEIGGVVTHWMPVPAPPVPDNAK